MKRLGLLCIFALALLFMPSSVSATNGPLRRSSNPSYFVDASGKAVYLSGQHTWWGFYTGGAAPGGNFDSLLSTYHNRGQNFTRMWTGDGVQSSLTNSSNNPKMWLNGPACCNQEHIDRLVALASKAKSYDMYISIMLHEGWWVGDNATTAVNWYNNHFFKSIEPDVNKYFTGVNGQVLSLQKQRIQRVVDALRPYDNIIYEICNECHILGGYRDENTQWQKDLVNYIHSLDSTKMVGFTDNGDTDINNQMLNSSADWVSIQGDNLINDPPVADTRKVHLLDTDHIQCATSAACGTTDDWVWKTFTKGYNPIIMDDWNNFGGKNAAAAAASGVTVWMANQKVVNLLGMRPNASPCNTTYCMSNGSEVVAYYPGGSSTPNFGTGWSYQMFNTTSKDPGNKVLYAYKSGVTPPNTNTPIPPPTNTSTPSQCNSTKPTDGSVFSIIPCASENSSCALSVSGWLKFGSNNSYCYQTFVAGNVNCSTSNFGGDPAPGQTKNCYTQVRTDYTYINSSYGTNSVNSDLNKDSLVNMLDFAVMISSKQW